MKFNTQISIWLILRSVVALAVPISSKSSATSSDSVSYLLSCGSTSVGSDSDGRKWEPDTNYLSPTSNWVSATAQFQDPSLPSPVPYMSSIIFTAQTSYEFSVSSKQRTWVRLHFYPTTYNSLDPSTAYFAVTANEFTLLSNFSAFLTAKALTQAYIIKEDSLLPIQSGTLNLTFTPSAKQNGAYAFVNGIEIIPMPEIFQSAKMVGFEDQVVDVNASAVESLYRLNVGGNYIGASNDSGLTRTWYDDTPYLYGASVGVTSKANSSVKIEHPSGMLNSMAPLDVYSTARSMGPTAELNKNYNLAWAFQVDPNFMYLVRFHFCDFQDTKANQVVFDIYVNNKTAQEGADIIGWTGSQGVPLYKDYVIFVNDVDGDDNSFYVALHPSMSAKPEFYDSILNGLEIFKVSDFNRSLAGPNPQPSEMLVQAEENAAKGFVSSDSGGKIAEVIGGVIGGAVGLALVVGIGIAIRNKRKPFRGDSSRCSPGWLPLYGSSRTTNTRSTMSAKSSASSNASTLAGGLCRHFSLREILDGTKNFNESLVIGIGGFGKVYLGTIDGRTKVAIKRSNPSSEQGVNEFETEIEMLSRLRHRHLVSLIGFCEEDDEMILVYDYMANGTLREHLYKHNKPHLSWKNRLEICIGAARGLHYLHTGAKHTIIHRDVKTTNILLDEKWVAKIADFGLSKTGPDLNNQTHVSTMVKGSFGYLDPEYFRRQQLTEKSDVYSFGVVLFEVLSARPALNPNLPKEQVSLADWCLHCLGNGTLQDLIDPYLKGKINPESLKKFSETAEKCLSDQGILRPSMGDVLWNLEFALQLHENPGMNQATAQQKANQAFAMHNITTLLTIDEDQEDTATSSTGTFTATATTTTTAENDSSSTSFSHISSRTDHR